MDVLFFGVVGLLLWYRVWAVPHEVPRGSPDPNRPARRDAEGRNRRRAHFYCFFFFFGGVGYPKEAGRRNVLWVDISIYDEGDADNVEKATADASEDAMDKIWDSVKTGSRHRWRGTALLFPGWYPPPMEAILITAAFALTSHVAPGAVVEPAKAAVMETWEHAIKTRATRCLPSERVGVRYFSVWCGMGNKKKKKKEREERKDRGDEEVKGGKKVREKEH